MMKEIYCKMPGNGYDSSALEISSAEEQIMQRARVCLGTKPGSVLGDSGFGIDLEEYIFNMSVDVNDIEDKVKTVLVEYALAGFDDEYTIDVSAYFGKNTSDQSDYLFIDIYLNEQKMLGVMVL